MPRVEIQIVEAQGLPKADANGKADPFVEVCTPNDKQRTEVKKATLNPVWREIKNMTIMNPARDAIGFLVYDWDRMSANDIIAYGCITLAGLPPGGQPLDTWIDLTKKGKKDKKDKKKDKPGKAGKPKKSGGRLHIILRASDFTPPPLPGAPAAPAPGMPGQPMYPGQPMPGMPYPGQPMPGQPYPGQPMPGQPMPYPGQPMPGQPYPPQPMPGQPMPGHPYPGQPMPGQPMPGQPMPAQPYPGQPMPGQPYPPQPMPGQPMYPGMPAPGMAYPGQPMPGMPPAGMPGVPHAGAPNGPRPLQVPTPYTGAEPIGFKNKKGVLRPKKTQAEAAADSASKACKKTFKAIGKLF